jgi:GAF domain-containing protein
MTQITKAALMTRVEALEKSLKRETELRKREAAERRRLEKTLADSLEQQTATSEILRVISSSPTEIQPVLDTLAASAARLCEAFDASIFRRDGDRLQLVAHHGPIPIRSVLPLVRGTSNGRAVLDGRTVHVADMQTEANEFPEGSENARRMGHRSILCVPLMRESVAIGTIHLRRTEARLFTERQVALLETFADQAVIAIENVRLFTQLEARNRDLTATSQVLQIISSSPTDVQPVFDAIADSAMRLFDALGVAVVRYEGQLISVAAARGGTPGSAAATVERFRALHRSTAGFPPEQTVLTQTMHHVADVDTDPSCSDEFRRHASERGFRSVLSMPMLRSGDAVGVIVVSRAQPGAFSTAEVELLKTFADQAVIAIENVRLFKELETRNHDLTETLEQQTATGNILRVISSSPTDVQPVFDTIVESAVRLCDGLFSSLFQFDGEMLHPGAMYNYTPEALEELHRVFPARPTRAFGVGRAILERASVPIPDVEADPDYQHHAAARAIGWRSGLFVPMLREDVPIGVIMVARTEPGPFSDNKVALLQTFADQAVIAIENVRLFTELQERNRDLAESLEQQTATADILRVISSSPTDVQPVFDTIAQRAKRLCDADECGVFRFDGALIHLTALADITAEWAQVLRSAFPRPPGRGSMTARAVLTRSVVHVPDVLADIEFDLTESARTSRVRSVLSVPMLRDGQVVGAITVDRYQPGPFLEKQISLLQTFADQAVIAIENVRLFKELEARNGDLTEALERQTATAEILRVISQSQTDVRPVFDAIADNAMRLFRAWAVTVFRVEGRTYRPATARGGRPGSGRLMLEHAGWPIDRETPAGRCILDRTPILIADIESDPLRAQTISPGQTILDFARARGWRSTLQVPMLRDEQAIGAISVARAEAGRFTEAEIVLLKTFADQAVIAVENARLLAELQERTRELTRSVDQLTALGEVGRAVSSTLDLETVLTTIVSRAVQLSGLDGGVVFEYDESTEEFIQRVATDTGALAEARRNTRIRRGEGVLGRTAITLEPVQVPDIITPGAYEGRLREILIESGIRAILAVPMVREGRLIGCLGVTRNRPGEFPAATIELLRTFATQSALAIQNARLFHEIEDKSQELEAASRHKSEFLANMSHELRTPLNAIIGFSEVLGERMFGELNEKQDEYLKDIYASGQHLLSLINDILDLSKIEAGRMELELAEFDLPSAIENALILVRERAGRRGIMLERTIDERLGVIRGDERKVKQVLLNLLSNALKFTPERGWIDVRARLVDGMAEISVADSGIGIAPEDQETVFEEFRQVGRAEQKIEGTGLGLALCRKFVELHGGRIWVKSEVGQGSTFTLTLPM